MMTLPMTSDGHLRWHVPHGDGQMIRVWRAAADSPTAARIATRSSTVDPLQSDSARLVFVGEASSHVLVVEHIDGLISANFFVARDAQAVLNLAEWSSAAAHRAALKPADFAEHGSIGHSETWRAAREHPAITRAHDVARYRFVGRSNGRDHGAW